MLWIYRQPSEWIISSPAGWNRLIGEPHCQWAINNIGSDNGLVPVRLQDIGWWECNYCTQEVICFESGRTRFESGRTRINWTLGYGILQQNIIIPYRLSIWSVCNKFHCRRALNNEQRQTQASLLIRSWYLHKHFGFVLITYCVIIFLGVPFNNMD